MSMLSFNDMVVGQSVAYINVHNSQFRVFKVVKITKMKIYFKAEVANDCTDFEEMIFDVKTGRRLYITWNEHSHGRFQSVEDAQLLLHAEIMREKKNQLFHELQFAVLKQNLTLINEIVKQLNGE